MRMAEIINEIGYAAQLDDSNFPLDRLMDMGQVDGQIEGNDVMVAAQGNQTVYFLVVDDQITAFFGFKDGNLKNIKNFTQSPGVMRALLGYLIHIKGQKIHIPSDESLTPDGFKWITHLIQNPRGLKIKDQDGNPIEIESLEKEWLMARSSGESGPTNITIGESKTFGDKLRINEQGRKKRSILMPFNFYDVKKQDVMEGTECTPTTYYLKQKPTQSLGRVDMEYPYPVYPEDDGTDKPRNPYGQH